MYHSTNILQGRPWLMLLALFAWLLPQTAAASYEDEADNYEVTLGGSNVVIINAPVYDQDGSDTWVYDGNLYVTWEGQSEKVQVLHWGAAETDIPSAQSSLRTSFKTSIEGFFDIKLGSSSSTTRLTKGKDVEGKLQRNSDGLTFDFTAEWAVPYSLLGKKLTFSWTVKRNGNGATVLNREVKNLKTVTITMPAASSKLEPFVSMAIPSQNHPGKIEVPWFLASDSIVSVYYEYDDVKGVHHKEYIKDINRGSILLNADEPHHNFRLVCSYKESAAKGTYLIEGVSSAKQDLGMLHAPIAMTARMVPGQKAKAEVKWSIPYVNEDDLAPTDFFEVQRSLTGLEADFVTVYQEPYIPTNKKATYTFIDSTLVEDVTERMLKNGGTLDNVVYRVRRTMTKDWNWAANSCYSSTRCILDNLHLLTIADYSAKWEDQRAYTVRASWQYGNEPGAVWDERAQMLMSVISRNKAGQVVDSVVYTLDPTDRARRYKVVPLTRSCVYYDIKVYVERGQSPLNLYEKVEDYFFPIRNAQDWATFHDMVDAAEGKRAVNARLYTDIAETNVYIAWGTSVAYNGVFDGNGHTLTVRTAANERVMAPFRYVGNATFINLHTAGVIKTSERDVAGLIANVLEGSTVNIIGCRSSVDIGTTYDGESNNGGFVAQVNKNATISMRNCKYDGSIEGEKSIKNGGFIGSVDTGGQIVIDNSLFEPKNIGTSSEDCHTWARTASGATLTLINSYATTEYSEYDLQNRFVINSANDWHRFAVAVNDAVNTKDINAILMRDITISEPCGVNTGAYYRGTFDGNGHTITFNKSGWTEDYIAPFRYVGNATIKNLHTTGSIQSNSAYATGLVAALVNNSTVTIENCHSSVNLNCTGSGDKTLSGFVGRLQDCTLTIRNCKFDGSFEGANSWGHAGFVSWAAPNTNVTIENCLFDPNNISTKLESCQTWARKDGASSAKVTVTNSEAITHYSPSTIIIRSADDWDKFAQLVKDAKNSYWVDAILQADISVKKSVGFDDAPWRGTLHGNGHTINIDIESGNDNFAALFPHVYSVTITDLHVKGKVNGGYYSAGLIGDAVSGDPTITLNHVWVSTEVTSTRSRAGGIIGNSDYANVNMNDVLFDGKVNTNNADDSYAGEIIGWSLGGSWSLQRVYDYGWPKAHWMFFCLDGASSWGTNSSSYTVTRHGWDNVNQHGKTNQSEVVSLMNDREAGTWQLVDGNAVPVMQTTEKALTETQLAEALGNDNWEIVGGKVVPKKLTSSSDVTVDKLLVNITGGWTKANNVLVPETSTMDYVTPTIVTHTADDFKEFYHENSGKIEKELLTQTRQSSVLLTWNTDGYPIDFFNVMRRVKGEGDNDWKVIATNLDQMSYEDTSVSPLATYEYKVVAINDCEGRDSTETQAKVGECKHTGRLEGYVRFNDGTSAAGIQVDVYHDGQQVTSVYTDDNGHYVADELSYYGNTKVDYEVSAVSRRPGVEFLPKRPSVTFNAHSNDETMREIVVQNGKHFSGFVMYDGTSIPVKGANFKVNGQTVYNTQGKVLETDYDGSFSFQVLPGIDTIQVVMNGHTFTNDGYYKSAAGHDFTADVANTYFYDATKVKLAGRVVGGNDQGKLPLMNNFSKNNLGDSLTIVLALEGDNTSWLVYDNQNPNRTERREVVRHQHNGDKHYTTVKTERKRMTIWPDERTGEYEVLLPPVRWKVQQVYCSGYPTLFQEGQVSEVVDLTDCLTQKDTTYVGTYKDIDTITVVDPKVSCHAVYNRIYHSPVEVTYRQLGYDTFSYFGDKNYMATDLAGNSTEVSLAWLDPKDSVTVHYSFGHPVYSVERKYTIELQVGENYYYNNDQRLKPDIVRLGGGMAMMQNGLKPGSFDAPVEVDSLGRARFTLQANQTPVLLTGDNALKTVTFTVLRDGTFIEAKPLQAYVLNMFPIGTSKDILTEGHPVLFDILRDPPGAYSTNTLAKGSTLNFSYAMNLTLTAGISMWFNTAKKLDLVDATVAAPSGAGKAVGPIMSGQAEEVSVNELMYNMQGNKAFSYTMVVNNNISTSGDPSMVGADADLYIGTVQNVVLTPMSTIRAVTKKMFEQKAGSLGGQNKGSTVAKNVSYGSMVKIADGINAKGDTIYLIRDVAIGYGPKMQSQFVYSQKQILTQIIPNKAKEIVDMMFCGTKAEAQAVANSTGRPVYWSLREPTDSMFAVVNRQMQKDTLYNYCKDKPEKGLNYMVVIPTGKSHKDFQDEVTEKYKILLDWTEIIAQNEMEKLQAHDLLTNYDIAGAQGVNYSETFDANYAESWTHHFPVVTEVNFFAPAASYGLAAGSIVGTILSSYLLSMKEMKFWKSPKVERTVVDEPGGDANGVIINFSGELKQYKIYPVAIYGTIGSTSGAKAYNRTESFTIACDPMSRLNVDVYRVRPNTSLKDSVGLTNIYTNYNFNKMYNEVYQQVESEVKDADIFGPRGFVFRTRGGATQNPWEDERKTIFYNSGRTLDERTLKICNPRIRLDKQSVSGVSVNDAAHFKVYVSNESEKPEATEGLTALTLFAVDQANKNGAKISVNGQTLTTNGMTVTVVPGTETELDMEVRAGQGFEFDGLTIGVMSPTDPVNTKELLAFNVHFLREAGGVNIAVPNDKWVLNTNAQVDSKRGWYIPVTINGFDRHQHNFDHIEFQYKESQRGDDAWTNLCSYYADSTLMAGANGVRELMKPNGNIVTRFYGEGWVTERTYDLRAVVFCRNGSDFLTTSSKVITGIKDTRRPQLFGTPEPKSGLLTAGDDIIFNFSEDIENNYLSAITNFEVKGEVNNNSISENVSVQFDGKGSIESDARRNFSGKDLTIDLMIKPDNAERDMPLFSHGTNGQKLQLWLTKDNKLKAVVNKQEFVSDSTITRRGFTQVAMTLNQKDSLVTFFNGGVQAGKPHKLTSLYIGTGPLIFGRTNELDRNGSQYYQGRMMEARLWYSAMDGGLIGTVYGGHRLTGFEKDLVDYYPMNEGSGKYVKDFTQGANARLIDVNWAIPRGLSLDLNKADKGVQLTSDALNTTADQDYTLMFWFRTDADGRGTLLSNGRGVKEDNGANNQFHIGFEGDTLRYRSNGFAVDVPGNWSDGGWHNFAMTVNRGRNVANIYIDKEVRATFEADSLGGISGGYPLIGATRYEVVSKNGDAQAVDADDAMTGNVDELMFFAQALPQQLIGTYASKSPNGDEAGLQTYLSFDRIERQKDNDLELVPYAYSKKLYLDDKGKPRYQLNPETKEPTDTLVRDYVFADAEDVILKRLTNKQAAPVVPNDNVTNLKFSFIGKDNQILVEIDETPSKLNHRNIYVTMRDVEDKNGNTMASPQTACYYVVNSSLQWMVNRLDYTMKYGAGEGVELPFYNYSATQHNYTIENCPKWLSLNKYEDVIAPQMLDYVKATVSKDLNVGTYNEIIYLTDEEGITEPFYLNLTVEGEQPDWAQNVSGELLKNSMSISGQVFIYDELDTDSRDIVGVFDDQNVCHGYANISHDVQSGETGLYLTVYDSLATGRDLNFRLWQYNTGRELVLTATPAVKFESGAVLGTDTPVRLEAKGSFVQYFNLKQGWNWVSFNLKSKQLDDVNKLLSSIRWNDGDVITPLGSNLTMTYEGDKKRWIASPGMKDFVISPQEAYAIKVKENCKLPIGGTVISDEESRKISVKQGWNAIGYTPMISLTVETALSDYYDQAETGDVIKSHTEFAYFTKTGNTGRWRGSLQYMKPGEGYMLLHKSTMRGSFIYPYYDLNSTYREVWSTAGTSRNAAQARQWRTTMSVSAVVEGFEPEDGDMLVAYANGEVVGSAALSANEAYEANGAKVLYLSIAGNEAPAVAAGGSLWFAIERDGEIVASTGEVMTYRAHAVVGTPDEPTAINFVKADFESGQWYTVSGIMLQKRPTKKGLYIYNGRKVVVK